jgi:hypothetical protein
MTVELGWAESRDELPLRASMAALIDRWGSPSPSHPIRAERTMPRAPNPRPVVALSSSSSPSLCACAGASEPSWAGIPARTCRRWASAQGRKLANCTSTVAAARVRLWAHCLRRPAVQRRRNGRSTPVNRNSQVRNRFQCPRGRHWPYGKLPRPSGGDMLEICRHVVESYCPPGRVELHTQR